MAEASPLYLVVDDDAVFRERLARALRKRGCEVVTAADADEAIASAWRESPERAVVDLRMPGRSGLELVKALKTIDPATQVLVLTGYGSIATAVEAIKLGATQYLTKPVDVDEIIGALEATGVPPAESVPVSARPLSVKRLEWEHIQRVLCDNGGNISATARALGIHRRTLQRKLHKRPVRA